MIFIKTIKFLIADYAISSFFNSVKRNLSIFRKDRPLEFEEMIDLIKEKPYFKNLSGVVVDRALYNLKYILRSQYSLCKLNTLPDEMIISTLYDMIQIEIVQLTGSRNGHDF